MQEIPHLTECDSRFPTRLRIPVFANVQEYVQDMYFVDPHGCVPAKYLGEDVMNNIHTKFYYPLAFIRWLFQKMHPKLKKDTLLITIDPSYESETNYIVHLYRQKIVLLQDSWNAWSFWFEDETEFEKWVDDCLEEGEGTIKEKQVG
jgi:hypothetical protein